MEVLNVRTARAWGVYWISGGLLALAVVLGLLVVARHSIGHPPRELIVRRAVATLERELSARADVPVRLVPGRRTVAGSPASPDGRDVGRARRANGLSAGSSLALAQLQNQPDLQSDALATLAAGLIASGRASEAVDLLEAARARRTVGARAYLALSAAYYTRGRASDFVRALDIADDGRSRFPEDALSFNASLAAARLLPARDVDSRWSAYLRRETDPGWRAIAKEHQTRAREQSTLAAYTREDFAARVSVPATAGGLRALYYDELLPRWADACGSVEARDIDRHATELRAAGQLMASAARDRYLDDVSASIASVPIPGPGPVPCDRARGALVRRFLDARKAYREDRRTDARALFEQLVPDLVQARNPLSIEARLYLAIMQYVTDTRASAATELDRVSALAARHGYSHLRARAEWMRGYISQDQRHYEEALAAFDRALAAYQDAGDRDGSVAAQTLRANLLDALGEYAAAWRAREQGLEGLAAVHDPRARYTMLSEAARAALRDGLRFAGLAFADAAYEAAGANKLRMIEAQVERARISASLGRTEDARRMLAEAGHSLAQQDASATGLRTRAALNAAESDLASVPSTRVQLLERAIQDYRSAGADIPLARLLLARGRAHVASGEEPAARTDFAEGIDIFETARRKLQSTDFRLSYFEEAWALFDEMIALCMRTGDLESALDYAVRSRGRDLRDRLAAAPPDTAGSIAREIPPGAVALFYVILQDETVVWVFSRGAVMPRRLPVPRARIQPLIQAFRATLTAGDIAAAATARMQSMALHDALVLPLADLIPPGAALGVALDPLMQSIPFAALQRRDTGAYLLQEHEITMLPALWAWSTAGRPRARDAKSSPNAARAFVVGDPWRDAARDENRWVALPQARAEASAVAALYSQSRVVLGRDATRATFLAEAGQYDVVHFAGHAQANPELPGLSRLMFASTPDRPGTDTLYAFDVAEQRFARTRVVVLAACETAGGRTFRSEGVTSLARAFLAAGVPDVVATLWAVSDKASRPLFEHLHSELRRGRSVAGALRATQLWSLASEDDTLRAPAVWAALVSVGSVMEQ